MNINIIKICEVVLKDKKTGKVLCNFPAEQITTIPDMKRQ